jgi:hypothetical protein
VSNLPQLIREKEPVPLNRTGGRKRIAAKLLRQLINHERINIQSERLLLRSVAFRRRRCQQWLVNDTPSFVGHHDHKTLVGELFLKEFFRAHTPPAIKPSDFSSHKIERTK